MASLPRPNCPTCHGSGEVETWHRDAKGNLLMVSYDDCYCTMRPLVVEEEDWTNDPPRQHRI